MKTNRVNIYGFPHKGLRYALGQLSFKIGNLDVNSQTSLDQIKQQAEEISELLKLHLGSEETHVLPHLEKEIPGSTTHNHKDHEAMEKLEHDMMNQIQNLHNHPSPSTAEKSYQITNLFIREYFRHMDEEEIELNKIIWENFVDSQILEWQGRILASLSPEQFFKWFKYIIPAINPVEQTMMLGEFKQNSPGDVFKQTIENLKPFVTQTQYNHLSLI